MKSSNLGIVALSLLSVSAITVSAQETLSFSALGNSAIQFGGSADTFTFLNSTPLVSLGTGGGYAQWDVTSESGSAATGSAIGLNGNIDNGPFSYGPITVIGISQIATVIGPLGDLDISDGAGGLLKGIVNAVDIQTVGTVGGFINAFLSINLSDVTYSGSNPDLEYLPANQPGSVDLGFQFSPGMTLQQLSEGSGGYDSTSYNGSIAVPGVVPEPSSLVMSALGGLGAIGVGFRRWKK